MVNIGSKSYQYQRSSDGFKPGQARTAVQAELLRLPGLQVLTRPNQDVHREPPNMVTAHAYFTHVY
jgi:hypothetical protein